MSVRTDIVFDGNDAVKLYGGAARPSKSLVTPAPVYTILLLSRPPFFSCAFSPPRARSRRVPSVRHALRFKLHRPRATVLNASRVQRPVPQVDAARLTFRNNTRVVPSHPAAYSYVVTKYLSRAPFDPLLTTPYRSVRRRLRLNFITRAKCVLSSARTTLPRKIVVEKRLNDSIVDDLSRDDRHRDGYPRMSTTLSVVDPSQGRTMD